MHDIGFARNKDQETNFDFEGKVHRKNNLMTNNCV